MSEPVAVELTDGLGDTTNVTVSLPRSVLEQLVRSGTWTGHQAAEVSVSGQEYSVGRVMINVFEG
ncbi:hypothetical protein J7F01_40360 [Streptomyces sp. ISL-22]|uniref:hypothetical protein n=1 Tax=unclassified Streptomyces TaxID=2593676 RepID=UPI001BE9565F|nr:MULTISPECIES: hypothetical protein [unclassified Streptomyces]MBT2420580.1 hypothetical protein [Streptomyces sp. ISL-24]MBT2438269.1 hypothetical protein [Streptomyces sp. ISL-22]